MLNREEKKIKLTVVSPVFIGDGESLNRSQYVLQEDKHRACIVDEEKLADLLIQKGKWDDFIQEMGRGQFKLKEFLESYQLIDAVDELCRYTIPCPVNTIKLNDINPFIKDYLYQPYIPGSSLKGSLRTTLTFGLIKQPEFGESRQRIWSQAVERLQRMNEEVQSIHDEKGRREARKKAWKDVTNLIGKELDRLFNKLPLKLDDFQKPWNDAVNDCLRGLSISDSRPFNASDLCLLQKNDAIIGTDIVNHGIPTFRECLTPGSRTEVKITLDLDCLKYIGIQSWQDVSPLLEHQKNFLLSWRRQAKKELPPLPAGTLLALGGGVGFQAKSILYALAPDDHEARRMVSKWLEHDFPKHRHWERDRQAAPRTVKLARWEDQWYDMGWVKLEEVNE